MAEAVWSFPTRILFGVGAVSDVGAEAHALGIRRALIVTDRGVVAAGLIAPVQKALSDRAIEAVVFDGLSTNPTQVEAEAAARAYRDATADGVVAVGGGAALDVAKLVRILVSQPLPLAEYDDAIGGDAKMTGPFPPMIALPTTAGTGSEVGRSAVATIAATGKKTIFFHPNLIPNVAVLDPKLTETLPAHATAATGFDALTHNMEAFLAKGDHPLADAIALKGIALCGENLERAVREPHDLEARGAMLKASMMGAVAFQKGLGVCHSLAHPLGAEHDLHHGLANALCLPAALTFIEQAAPAEVAAVAQALFPADDQGEGCAERVRALRERVGLPGGLNQVGIKPADLPKLARLAFEDGCHQSGRRVCSQADMEALYRASM